MNINTCTYLLNRDENPGSEIYNIRKKQLKDATINTYVGGDERPALAQR